MIKIKDKLSRLLHINKKTRIFILVFLIVGIISGSLFTIILDSGDKLLIQNYMNSFFNNIGKSTNNINYLLNIGSSNILYLIIIWVLGISVIGLPIVLVVLFSKSFVVGFTITSLIYNYKLLGLALATFYVFPHILLLLIVYAVVTVYSMKFSVSIFNNLFSKNKIDLKRLFKIYLEVLLIALAFIIIISLYETYVLPYVIKIILSIFA